MNATSHARTTHCIDVCNRLLRGELSAVETYGQAIRKFADQAGIDRLSEIRDDHVKSAERLEANIRQMGGQPDLDSGTWGRFAQAVQAAANLFGENSAVGSLESGERHGRNEYQEALDDDEVLPECKDLIRRELLPRLDQHLAVLERFGKA